MIKVIIVGRHTPKGLPENIEVVGTENVLFSLNRDECWEQISDLFVKAASLDAKVLFQNTPGVVTSALISLGQQTGVSLNCGVIISVPGERKADVSKLFSLNVGDMFQDHDKIIDMVKFANGRAKCEAEIVSGVFKVTVDPVPEFVFSHIEWF